MTPEIKPLVAGNWKMNGLHNALHELEAMARGYNTELRGLLDMLVCVPATLIHSAAKRAGSSSVMVGGQDCHMSTNGAHTGDVSAEMIADCGANAVIVGHSERRTDHGETSETVKAKAEAGLRAGLLTIVCIGETEAERKSGKTLDVLGEQLSGSMPANAAAQTVVVAYEPVWAIGTGLTPTIDDIHEAHGFMRKTLSGSFSGEGSKMRLLYGGSVKPSNASELMAVENVDGALVGGASLKAADFLGICNAYRDINAS